MSDQSYSLLDRVLIAIDNGICTVCGAARPSPAQREGEADLTQEQRKHSAALMRINHTGEVCAQGLYYGAISDKWSLEFVVETERQVEQHLKDHLQKLLANDNKCRLILEQMCVEEAHHATAMSAGAGVTHIGKKIMRVMSKMMTTITHHI